MNKILCCLSVFFLASCTSVLTDIASFKDPDFNNREPVKVMALVVNNTTMQNINRVQFAMKETLTDEKIDVKFLDHYSVNPPTRKLSEDELKESLATKWNADALLFINVVSETGKTKGVDGDLVDVEGALKEKGKSDNYTTIAYGKYTASLMDIATWRTIWKADLISIDEKFKNTNTMYQLAAEKIVADLVNKGLLTIIKDKNHNNIVSYDLGIKNTDSVVDNAKNVNIENNKPTVDGVIGTINNASEIAKIIQEKKEVEQNTDGKAVNGSDEKNVSVRPLIITPKNTEEIVETPAAEKEVKQVAPVIEKALDKVEADIDAVIESDEPAVQIVENNNEKPAESEETEINDSFKVNVDAVESETDDKLSDDYEEQNDTDIFADAS
ncbi:MAG: hypothetical protein LBU68_00830 [Rickettsiales bacterium]|jgi:hypothetical protein|nr:hypothetical protein [Rickettsiales bacterium]